MLEIIILCFVFYVGYNLGQIVLSWQLRHLIVKEARKEGMKIDSEFNIVEIVDTPNVHKLIVEKTNNMLYLYDHEANSFVCQASTMEELATLAKEYNNIKYAAVMDVDGDSIYTFVDGKVKVKL